MNTITYANERRKFSKGGPAVDTIDNRIYFYDEINEDSVLEFNKSLRQLDVSNRIFEQIHELSCGIPIFIHVCSGGGYISLGMSALDNIVQTKSKTISIVEGTVASAATFLSIAADERWMHRNSKMMIHQAGVNPGFTKAEELEDAKENMDVVMNMVRQIYKEYTKLPMKKLNEILKHDLYLTAAECKKYGLIDKIIN